MDQVATDLDGLDMNQLDVHERRIAGRYMNIVPWGAVVWGIGNCLVFIALFPLVLLDIVPLWLASPIAVLNVMLAYLPSHEAQHNIIAGTGKPLRWLNELVGHVSTIPLVYPYRVLRATHMEHHKHCNHPEKDCDIDVHAKSNADFFRKALLNRQPASDRNGAYARCLERTGQSALMLDAVLMQSAYLLILFAMAWTGHAIEAAFSVVAAEDCRRNLPALFPRLGTTLPRPRAGSLPGYPRIQESTRQRSVHGHAVPHRAPPVPAHPAIADTGGLP